MNKYFYRIDEIDPLPSFAQDCSSSVLILWASDCAERVLHFFEDVYPEQILVREAIGAVRLFLLGLIPKKEIHLSIRHCEAISQSVSDISLRMVVRAVQYTCYSVFYKTSVFYAVNASCAAIFYQTPEEKRMEIVEKERNWQLHHLTYLKEKSISNGKV